MAKTEDQIYMDFKGMCQKAEQLDGLASQIEKLADDKIAPYSANQKLWVGDSGDAFCEKARKLDNNLREKAKQLRKISSGIQKAAQRQYQVEKTLVSLVSR